MKSPTLFIEAYSLWEFIAALEDAWLAGYRVNRDDVAKVPQSAGTYHYATLDLDLALCGEPVDARTLDKPTEPVLVGVAVPEAEPEAPVKKTRAKRKVDTAVEPEDSTSPDKDKPEA